MTKSFPKAAAQADDVPLPGAKPDDKKVCVPNACQHSASSRYIVQQHESIAAVCCVYML